MMHKDLYLCCALYSETYPMPWAENLPPRLPEPPVKHTHILLSISLGSASLGKAAVEQHLEF